MLPFAPRRVWSRLLVGAAFVSLAFGQVNLLTVNPSATQPGDPVYVFGNGFPNGVINSATVSVTPPSGNGSPVTTTGLVSGAGAFRQVAFVLPVALTSNQLLDCQVAVSGTTVGGTQFSTVTAAALQVQPPAVVLSATPGATQLGTLGLTLAGNGAVHALHQQHDRHPYAGPNGSAAGNHHHQPDC